MDSSTRLPGERNPADRAPATPRLRGHHRFGRVSSGRLTGGGTDGNRQLTAITGTILLVLLAVIGVTILRIGQLISVHLFVGLLLIGPVVLKLASTGYRFARYYSHNRAYRREGPPATPYWTRFITYRYPGAGDRANLLPTMDRSPERCLTPDDRDFFAVYTR
jgi:hypothetical protein